MGFNSKTWSNPVNLDANNLNRIELGIKNSHDTLEIIKEEVSNLQTRYTDALKTLETLTNSPDILDTLNSISDSLKDTDVSILFDSNKMLLKEEQQLTKEELNQVYKNLRLNSFISYSNFIINGETPTLGQPIEIIIDNKLNKYSTNPISNKAVAEALANLGGSSSITKLSQLEDDPEHRLVTDELIAKWNSMTNSGAGNSGDGNSSGGISNETDPTVPDWAKQPEKPLYAFNELLGIPDFITINDAHSYTDTKISELLDSAPETLNTLREIANALHNDPEIIATLNSAIGLKADQTSLNKTNELVSTIKTKLDTIIEGAQVISVNNKTGVISLTASDVGALPSDTELFSGDYNDLINLPTIPATVAELTDAWEYAKYIDLPEIQDNPGAYLQKSSGSGKYYREHTNGVSERTIAAALPYINGSHSYTENVDIYAPTSSGTTGQILVANSASIPETMYGGDSWTTKTTGGTPEWKSPEDAGLITTNNISSYTTKIYTGTSSTQSSNTTVTKTLRFGYTSGNLYIWNS